MRLHRSLAVLVAACACLASVRPAHADGDGTFINALNPCCPCYEKHHFEGPPKIKFKPGCPKPICPCGSFEHFGYYPTCWAPWPYPPDYRHCCVPPVAAMVPPSTGRPAVKTEAHDALPDPEESPLPRKGP